MTLHSLKTRHMIGQARAQCARLKHNLMTTASRRPAVSAAVLLVAGLAAGSGLQAAQVAQLQARAAGQQDQLELTRREAQREVNALAARLGELQAQANRLNALGDRLTRVARLGDGEFDFNTPVGIGGAGPVQDMAARELRAGMGEVQAEFKTSGDQLSVLEALLFDRELDRNATPSRYPVAKGYITSGFGGRADPFGGGRQHHNGIDFHARTGDPVLAVADGVVSYSGVRAGYGNVVEVDHGNGYVTRYAHNSRNVVKVGDLVRIGQQIARAGSTGRSTAPHVHFEVWENGRVVNPRKFLGDQGVKRG
ncbi:MAG: M23 family metallopeptidase [Pseudomonadota bacterium]|nr:M23 family metallopeptidase [Pseudomonadota bacterium]